MQTLKIVRYVVWAAVVVVAAAVLWFGVIAKDNGTGGGGLGGLASATVGGPFSLTDQNGNTVTEAALKGHPSALFFGYTYCPDVCPTTLSDLTVWMGKLGADADKLKVYFITVDPERDTQDEMASYLQAFDPRIIGLTGPRPAIDKILKEYRVYSRKVGDGANYTMDHTATVYLLDKNANFVGTLDYQESDETAFKKLKNLVAS